MTERGPKEPDGDLCLWLTVAHVPAGAPDGSAGVARRVLGELAARYDGIAIEPGAETGPGAG